MKHFLTPVTLAVAIALPGQSRAVVPAACTYLPGNAALSMPLRWSQGLMQVRIDPQLLPANFIGHQITGLRLRRPEMLGEPAYAAVSRTLEVRAAFDSRLASTLSQSRDFNRLTGSVAPPTVFGPAVVQVGATAANGPATSTGDEFLVIPFSTPLTVIAGGLLLEFESSNAPFAVLADNWVDAVWFENGVETGYAVTVGDGSCTTRTTPTRLLWNDPAAGPHAGGQLALRLTGAAPNSMVFGWIGFDPATRASSALYFGYGGSLGLLSASLANCHQWAPVDVSWSGTADSGGGYNQSFTMPSGIFAVGAKVGCQAAWVDVNRAGFPMSVSNGVELVTGNIGVYLRCATAFFPGTATWSPWPAYGGQMPVIVIEYT